MSRTLTVIMNFMLPVACCSLRIFQYLWLHNGYVQDDEKTNIYVGMHVDGFRNFNPICGSSEIKIGTHFSTS